MGAKSIPDYVPPTIADLARVEKGGGGETVEKRYLAVGRDQIVHKGIIPPRRWWQFWRWSR